MGCIAEKQKVQRTLRWLSHGQPTHCWRQNHLCRETWVIQGTNKFSKTEGLQSKISQRPLQNKWPKPRQPLLAPQAVITPGCGLKANLLSVLDDGILHRRWEDIQDVLHCLGLWANQLASLAGIGIVILHLNHKATKRKWPPMSHLLILRNWKQLKIESLLGNMHPVNKQWISGMQRIAPHRGWNPRTAVAGCCWSMFLAAKMRDKQVGQTNLHLLIALGRQNEKLSTTGSPTQHSVAFWLILEQRA